jgi:hypothetical protein
MKIRVIMLAFHGPDTIREVDVPDSEITFAVNRGETREERLQSVLSLVYHYGQNDNQPMPMPSVSMGDVIRYACGLYVVQANGFAELGATDLLDYLNMSQRDRHISTFVRPK